MSSIALPALALKPVEQPDVTAQVGRILQLKQMMQGQQLQQQQLQGAEMENQQRQLALQDQQKVRDAFLSSGGDMDKFYTTAEQSGVSPQTLIGIKNSILEQRQKLASLSKAEQDAMQAKNTAIGQAAGSLLQLPPEQRKAALPTMLNGLVQNGAMDQNAAQGFLQQAAQLDDASLEQQLKLHQFNALAADKQLSEVRAAQESAASLPGKQAQAEQQTSSANAQRLANIFRNGGAKAYQQALGDMPYRFAAQFPANPQNVDEILKPGLTPEQQINQPVDRQVMNDWLAKNPGKSASDFYMWKARQSPMFMNMSNMLSPEALQLAAQLYVQTGQLPAGFGRSPSTTASVINTAASNNPTADIASNKIQYQTRAALNKDFFGGGKASQNIRSLNTAVGHLNQLYDAATALQNGDVKALNGIANYFKVQGGNSAPSVFDAIKTAATGELGSTFKGAAATDPEIANLAATLNKDLSGKVNQDVIKTDLHLLASRLYALEEQYKVNNNGQAAAPGRILYNGSRKVFDRMNIKPEEQAGGNTNPNGGDFWSQQTRIK